LSENHELNGHQRRKRKTEDTVRPRTVAAVLSPYAQGAHREERDRDAKLEEAVGLGERQPDDGQGALAARRLQPMGCEGRLLGGDDDALAVDEGAVDIEENELQGSFPVRRVLALRFVGVAELRGVHVPIAALVAGRGKQAETDDDSDTDDTLHDGSPLVARTIFKNPLIGQKLQPETIGPSWLFRSAGLSSRPALQLGSFCRMGMGHNNR